ncbi:hypothetical protein [Luteolibacter sp. AS25]|uniref:BatD family protein n=1 Tax=Luteolibacter sp. AS25 TaxID=3135776 RepID=UPI00398B8EF2
MNTFLIKTLGMLLVTAAMSSAAISSRISSKFLVPGERAMLEIRVDGQEPDQPPSLGEIEGLSLQLLDFGMRRDFPQNKLEYVYQYALVSYKLGEHTIPEVSLSVDGVTFTSEAINFQVFDIEELQLARVTSNPTQYRDEVAFASVVKISEDKVYENQTVDAEIKVYVPSDVAGTMQDWGVPEFERSGLAAWRFEPSDLQGNVTYLGKSYSTKAYSTTISALRSGRVSIGPATVRLTYQKMVFDRFAQRVNLQATLDIAELGFEVQPLPAGAPDGFDNAVGQFSLEATMSQREVVEGEPLAVDVVVRGRGNLDKLRSPKLTDESGWKIYDATPQQRGEERRNLSGAVVFSQFIRPLEMKTSVPPFRLVFFNPEVEDYEIVTSSFIPLDMTPSTAAKVMESSGPPQALPIPVERMTDILSPIKGTPLLVSSGPLVPTWIWHVLGGLVSLGLILKALWMRFAHLLEKDEVKSKKRSEFMKVSNSASQGDIGFLKAAGAFVERWLPVDGNLELKRIIEERDELCFRGGNQDAALPKQRKNEILKHIRRAAFAIFLTASVLYSGNLHAEEDAQAAYESASYEKAAKLWLEAGPFEQLSADTLYNIGNAAFRMGAPGQAALYYRRALVKNAVHEEARQNLRFLERKYGSITVQRPDYQYVLGKISLDTWKAGLWCGVWILAVGLLIFPATRRGARWRVLGVIGFILGPILISLGALGWRHYPDDAEFAPLAKQGVIIGEKVVLHTDAARTSSQVIDAPPGSLAEVIRRTGDWSYIGFATKTRGWVPTESIEMIVPEGKPEVPKVRKATVDGSSA